MILCLFNCIVSYFLLFIGEFCCLYFGDFLMEEMAESATETAVAGAKLQVCP